MQNPVTAPTYRPTIGFKTALKHIIILLIIALLFGVVYGREGLFVTDGFALFAWPFMFVVVFLPLFLVFYLFRKQFFLWYIYAPLSYLSSESFSDRLINTGTNYSRRLVVASAYFGCFLTLYLVLLIIQVSSKRVNITRQAVIGIGILIVVQMVAVPIAFRQIDKTGDILSESKHMKPSLKGIVTTDQNCGSGIYYPEFETCDGLSRFGDDARKIMYTKQTRSPEDNLKAAAEEAKERCFGKDLSYGSRENNKIATTPKGHQYLESVNPERFYQLTGEKYAWNLYCFVRGVNYYYITRADKTEANKQAHAAFPIETIIDSFQPVE